MNERGLMMWPGSGNDYAYPVPQQRQPAAQYHLIPAGQQLATPSPAAGLDKLLNLDIEFWDDFNSASNHSTGTSAAPPRGGPAQRFPELRVPEDRKFAQDIIDALYALEPDNSRMKVTSAMGSGQFYVWAERWKVLVPETFSLLRNISYPKQNVSGVRTVAVWNSSDGILSRLVVGFVPQHMTQPGSAPLMLTAPVQAVKPIIRRADSESEDEEEERHPRRHSNRDASPVRDASPQPGFLRRALGMAAAPEPKGRRRR
jgi:hypothetical protein